MRLSSYTTSKIEQRALTSPSDLPEERHDRRKASPGLPRDDYESSGGETPDEYRQDKPARKTKKARRERDDDEERRPTQKKRKRKQLVEADLADLPPEQARKTQLQMKIDAIVKSNKTHRPKKRKKDVEEDVLDRFADEEVSQLREEMLRAAAEDDDANREKLPGTSKLRLLPRVKEVLQKYV